MSKTVVFFLLVMVTIGGAIALRSKQPNDDVEHDSLTPSRNRLVVQRGTTGFDLRNATIPENEIRAGGPPKDGIPALSTPKLVKAVEVDYLDNEDRVIGVRVGSEARAYPIRILNLHEIVNDRIGDVPIMVTYCPLCDSAAVFDRRTPIGEREFGVSGLLYNSNVLMYDRGGQPESLWSQVLGEGVSGPAAGKKLKALPMELTTWGQWKTSHTDTLVLSANTGHARNYGRNPYAGYFNTPNLIFPVRPVDQRLSAKTPILAVWTSEGKSNAHPTAGSRADASFIGEYSVGGRAYSIAFDQKTKTARVIESDEGVYWMHSFWFAWSAFHANAEIVAD